MEILMQGAVKTEAQMEKLVDLAFSIGAEIITPGRDSEQDDELNYWAVIREADGMERLYMGSEVTFARYVAATTGVN